MESRFLEPPEETIISSRNSELGDNGSNRLQMQWERIWFELVRGRKKNRRYTAACHVTHWHNAGHMTTVLIGSKARRVENYKPFTFHITKHHKSIIWQGRFYFNLSGKQLAIPLKSNISCYIIQGNPIGFVFYRQQRT